MKKEVSISLDEDIIKKINKLCEDNYGAKRSTIINSILKKNLNNKKKNVKNKISKR